MIAQPPLSCVTLGGLIESGKVTPAVDQVCTLSALPGVMRDREVSRVGARPPLRYCWFSIQARNSKGG